MKRPTIVEIARRAGVSKVAVSYALNGQPGVSETTRQKVLAIAEELGWVANGAARALSGAATRTVGMVLRRPARILGVEPFFMELISGVEAGLSAQDYALTLQVAAGIEAEMAVYRRWWAGSQVDGVLLCDLQVDDARVAVLEELELPAVVIGASDGAGGLVSLWSNDGAAVTEAVEYLFTLGHRRIARVGGLPELLHTQVRTQAFTEACQSLDLAPGLTIPTDYTGEQGARATRRLLISRDRPTAIIYDNDVMAIAGLAVAQEMGLAVPGDLALVAWDDSVLCQLVHPPLTAMSRDIPAYGAHAVSMLLDIITGVGAASMEDEPPHLVPRGSTGRAAG